MIIKKVKTNCIDAKAGTAPQAQPDDKKLDFITPLLGVLDTNKGHINIDWTSGGLDALNPKDMVKKVTIAEMTGGDGVPAPKEMFLYMSPKETIVFETDKEAPTYSFKTSSIQQLCATEYFCGLNEVAPIHFNNKLE